MKRPILTVAKLGLALAWVACTSSRREDIGDRAVSDPTPEVPSSSPSAPEATKGPTGTAADPPEASTPGPADWQVGWRYGYRLKLVSQVSFGASGAVDFDLLADVEWAPIEVGPDRTTLSLSLHGARFVSRVPAAQPELDRLTTELGKPYVVTLARGLVEDARIASGTPALVAGVYRTLSAALQFATPPERSAARWTAREFDTTGEYGVEYQRGTAPGHYIKKKTRYFSVLGSPAQTFAPEVRLSEGEMTLSHAGRPLRVRFRDDLEIENDSAPIVSRTELTLETTRDIERAAPSLDLAGMDVVRADQTYRGAVETDALDTARIGGLEYERIVAEIDALAAQETTSAGSSDAATETNPAASERLQKNGRLLVALAATFRQQPETVELALARIQARAPGKQTLIDALAASGSPVAQAALSRLIQAPGIDPSERHNLVLSLSRTPEPSEESVRTLEALLGDERTGAQALYGLGTFSRRLRDAGDSGGAARLAELLLSRLARARTEIAVSRALRALSNSGYAPAIDRIEPFLVDRREQLRDDAVDALRLMASAEADELIALRLREDTSPRVRQAAIAAAAIREPAAIVVRALQHASQKDTDPHVRYRATELLVQWLPRRPELRGTLRAVARSDSEAQVRDLAKSAI